MKGKLTANMRNGTTTVSCETDAPLLMATSLIGPLARKLRSLVDDCPEREEIIFAMAVDFHRCLTGDGKEIYTLQELVESDMWPYRHRTTYQLLADGKLKGIRLDGKWLIRRSDALRYLDV